MTPYETIEKLTAIVVLLFEAAEAVDNQNISSELFNASRMVGEEIQEVVLRVYTDTGELLPRPRIKGDSSYTDDADLLKIADDLLYIDSILLNMELSNPRQIRDSIKRGIVMLLTANRMTTAYGVFATPREVLGNER